MKEFYRTKLDDDMYEAHCNIADILKDVFDNAATDLLTEDILPSITGSLLQFCRESNSDFPCKVPGLLTKLNLYCQKKKVQVNFASVLQETEAVVAYLADNVKLYTQEEVATSEQTDKEKVSLPRAPEGRKCLQLAEIVEFLMSQNNADVNKLLISASFLPQMTVDFKSSSTCLKSTLGTTYFMTRSLV